MERKLATVLFIDLVDSTSLVTGADPEVVRRRVTEFFDHVSRCVEQHGGIVEKFAGDAVLAAFGVPQSHEDDALRAARAALDMRAAVRELGLDARIGIEAGELVVDQASSSSFVTGEAVTLAARLQQAAKPDEILVGPTARRLAAGGLVVEDAGPLELKGLEQPLRAWRVVDVLHEPAPASGPTAPLVGREAELELLENVLARTVRDCRAHLFTVFGEAGVGKSRLVREFVDGVERASVLTGRCLPYGEGVTYWPLAEMVKAAAGISDDDPLEEAFAKLRACCAEEAVADVLGLATGLMEALEGERGAQDIAWAAREVMEKLSDVQPLILLFEDIHWAEPPLLDLVEHLADGVRGALLIVCVARPELLDTRPGWGGGRVRSTAIELEPLSREESAQLVAGLLSQLDSRPEIPDDLFETTEGNPLFVEETVRMLLESEDVGADRVPDTLQALIAARIDHLPPEGKLVLQRASVIGRVFWRGALAHLAPDVDDIDRLLDGLLARELVLRNPRSSISGETAYRFKHLLIREVAYGGLSKLARAQHHARFAGWIRDRAGDDLLEIRAHHLNEAVELLTELEGAAPPELASETAEVMLKSAKRAIAREAYATARKLALRSLELRPSLRARYVAARAAWRLLDFATVEREMARVRDEARAEGEPVIEALALAGLADATLRREGAPDKAVALADESLALLARESDPVASFDALLVRAMAGAWRGEVAVSLAYLEQAYEAAVEAERVDLQSIATQGLAQFAVLRLDLDTAEQLLRRALELGSDSGSVRARMQTMVAYGGFLIQLGEEAAASTLFEEIRETATELGFETVAAVALFKLGYLDRRRGDLRAAESHMREALRITIARGDRGYVPDVYAELALTLAQAGNVEEAERLALESRALAAPGDVGCEVAGMTALGVVRAAQGDDAEAEGLFRGAVELARSRDFKAVEIEPLEQIAAFLRERGREAEASVYEERLAGLVPASSTARIA